jgi:uncharacterized protein involved in exopolysaccharide biosynthesis
LDDSVDLKVLVRRIWSKRVWIMTSVIVCTAAFAVLAFTMTPIYRASSVFVPTNVGRLGGGGLLGGALGGSLGDIASLAGVNLGAGGTETEEALAVLRSRQFTEAFIADRHLMPELFPDSWDAQRHDWKQDIVPPTPGRAYKYFDQGIRTIVQDKKSGLITLQIDWRDRLEGAEWANELVRRLNAEMRSRAVDKANASVAYLQKELASATEVGTREAVSRLMEAQIKQRMVANVTEEYSFRIVDRAMAPDKKDVVKPKKVALLAAGLAMGFFVGIFGVLLVDRLR